MAPDSLDRVCRVFFSLISSVPRLTDLFQQWCTLDDDEKMAVDIEVMDVLGEEYEDRYTAIREALIRWEIVQDTEGAPGFTKCAIFDYFITEETEPEVMKVVKTIEQSMDQIIKAKCNDESKNNSDMETETEEYLEIGYKPIFDIRRSKSINDLLKPDNAKRYRIPVAMRMQTCTNAKLNYDTD